MNATGITEEMRKHMLFYLKVASATQFEYWLYGREEAGEMLLDREDEKEVASLLAIALEYADLVGPGWRDTPEMQSYKELVSKWLATFERRSEEVAT
jgi:hypothetical protein